MPVPYGDLEPGMIIKLYPDGYLQELRSRPVQYKGTAYGTSEWPRFIPWSPPWYEIVFGWPVVFVWLAWMVWKGIRQ